MAVYLVLMPIFEADFHPRSYGFRPKRSAHQAVEAVREALRIGKVEVVDADLAKYFDTIPHRKLLKQVARRVSDGMILKLIKSWLRAPVLKEDEGGGRKIVSSRQGTPQGGVISPLLAIICSRPLWRSLRADPSIYGSSSSAVAMAQIWQPEREIQTLARPATLR